MTFEPEPGALVGDRFRLRERIDAGGFATVWRAVDESSGDRVAVKCGDDGTHDRAAVRDRFRRELAAFRQLAGPMVPGSLVRFVDGAVGGDTAYVAVELLDGGSLENPSDLEWGPPALATAGRAALGALDFLHRHGVVHLDLKPGNVVFRRDGPPAVVDFNAAVAAGESSVLFHHDPFKPPELTPTDLRDRPVGPRSDVYSLGALLAYLWDGRVRGYEAAAVADWAPIDLGDAGAPAGLAEHVRRATAPLPEDRFSDASALSAAVAPQLDPTGRVARLTHERSGRTLRVHPGATLGRWQADAAVPDVVLADADRHLSPVHAVLVADDGWALRDRSLNGTYVDPTGKGAWRYVLSAEGARRQRAAGRTPPDAPALLDLSDGARIAPVDTGLGFEMQFAVEV